MLRIEILYSPKDAALIQRYLDLPDGSTVMQALDKSGIYSLYPETRELSVGIFSRIVTLETVLNNGDRVEIYRPLTINPMDKRRQRAKNK